VIPPGLYLADTSAAARASSPPVKTELTRLGRLGLLATFVTVDLEVLFSARTPAEYVQIATLREASFTDLPMTEEIGARARHVQRMLARVSQHRAAGVIDLLTAAACEHYGVTILHYDKDFDHIAAITGQPTKWVVPQGSIS
jgi:predicted nucleic acid-binding protein